MVPLETCTPVVVLHIVLTECTAALVVCWLRLLGSQWGWLRFFSKEGFGKWREVKKNLGMKLYLFHIVCTGVSCTWFRILYGHLGQGVGLMLSCESWENAKFCLLNIFFHPNICILRVPLFWESLTLWSTQADFPLFQAAGLKVVIALISQHNALYLQTWEVCRKFQLWGSCIAGVCASCCTAWYSDALLAS